MASPTATFTIHVRGDDDVILSSNIRDVMRRNSFPRSVWSEATSGLTWLKDTKRVSARSPSFTSETLPLFHHNDSFKSPLAPVCDAIKTVTEGLLRDLQKTNRDVAARQAAGGKSLKRLEAETLLSAGSLAKAVSRQQMSNARQELEHLQSEAQTCVSDIALDLRHMTLTTSAEALECMSSELVQTYSRRWDEFCQVLSEEKARAAETRPTGAWYDKAVQEADDYGDATDLVEGRSAHIILDLARRRATAYYMKYSAAALSAGVTQTIKLRTVVRKSANMEPKPVEDLEPLRESLKLQFFKHKKSLQEVDPHFADALRSADVDEDLWNDFPWRSFFNGFDPFTRFSDFAKQLKKVGTDPHEHSEAYRSLMREEEEERVKREDRRRKSEPIIDEVAKDDSDSRSEDEEVSGLAAERAILTNRYGPLDPLHFSLENMSDTPTALRPIRFVRPKWHPEGERSSSTAYKASRVVHVTRSVETTVDLRAERMGKVAAPSLWQGGSSTAGWRDRLVPGTIQYAARHQQAKAQWEKWEALRAQGKWTPQSAHLFVEGNEGQKARKTGSGWDSVRTKGSHGWKESYHHQPMPEIPDVPNASVATWLARGAQDVVQESEEGEGQSGEESETSDDGIAPENSDDQDYGESEEEVGDSQGSDGNNQGSNDQGEEETTTDDEGYVHSEPDISGTQSDRGGEPLNVFGDAAEMGRDSYRRRGSYDILHWS